MLPTVRLLGLLLLLAVVATAEEWRLPRGNLLNTGVTKNKGPLKKPSVVWKREENEAIGRGMALAGGQLIYGVG